MSKLAAGDDASPTDTLTRVLTRLSAFPVAVIVALTFADVLGRYIFAAPVTGGLEIIEFSMALVIFIALPVVTRQRGHVTVELIDTLFTGWKQRLKLVLCDGISALALGILTWRLYLQGVDDLESRSATIVLNLPQAPLSFALTLFAGITTLVVLMQIKQVLTAPESKS